MFSAEEIRNDIFHKENKNSLLRKLKIDIIDSEIFFESNLPNSPIKNCQINQQNIKISFKKTA